MTALNLSLQEQYLQDRIDDLEQRITEMRAHHVQESFMLQQQCRALLEQLTKVEMTKDSLPIIIKH